jgi:hypothetical protein
VKTPLVRWLWELVKGFNQDVKKAFLVFVTGVIGRLLVGSRSSI